MSRDDRADSSTLATRQAMNIDADWLVSLKRLDEAAWDLLMRHYAGELRDGIRQSLARRGLSLSLTDDVEGETWLTAVRKIGEFQTDDVDKLFHWLRAISFKHVLTVQRKQADAVSLDDRADADADESLERFSALYGLTTISIEEAVARREQLVAVEGALRTLKPQERELMLRWLMGEPPRELAAAFGLKARSVSMILLRAKEKIEANLLLNLLGRQDE